MNAPAWIVSAAFSILFLTIGTPTMAGDPYSVRRQILGDEAQSRLENERRLREHNERLNRAMRQMEQMDRGSSSQTYYLGCDDPVNDPNDPDCPPLKSDRATPRQPGKAPNVHVPSPTPGYPPPVSQTMPSYRGNASPQDSNCVDMGLLGAPTYDCSNQSAPQPRKPAQYVGEGPCKHKVGMTAREMQMRGPSFWLRCSDYLNQQAEKACGRNRYTDDYRWCRQRVEDRVMESM